MHAYALVTMYTTRHYRRKVPRGNASKPSPSSLSRVRNPGTAQARNTYKPSVHTRRQERAPQHAFPHVPSPQVLHTFHPRSAHLSAPDRWIRGAAPSPSPSGGNPGWLRCALRCVGVGLRNTRCGNPARVTRAGGLSMILYAAGWVWA